jgi:tetratricopeptide (TPR) repeat protein
LEAKANEAEAKVRDAEAKGKTDPSMAAKVPELKSAAEAARAEANTRVPDLKKQVKEKLDQAVFQFERSVELDPSLLEARLNLGEVYTQLGKHEEATKHYLRILDLDSTSVTEKDTINNFSQACYGLARIAFAKNKPDEGFALLQKSVAKNPGNMTAFELFARELFLHDKNHEGEQVVGLWLAKWPPLMRPAQADRLGGQFAAEGKMQQAVRAWGIAAWIFATSPEPKLRNPQVAGKLAERIVQITKELDPLSLDTRAAAAAAVGRFDIAVRDAQRAIDLANRQGNKALAEMISVRLPYYQRGAPYVSRPDGSDRP